MKYIIIAIILIVGILFSCKDEDTFKTDFSDFEDLELVDSSFWDGSDGLGYFIDGNKTYENTYYPDWDTWSGFAYSNMKNIKYYNKSAIYSAYPSGGADESKNFAVAHQLNKIIVRFNDVNGEEPRSVRLTNTTYTALSLLYGYGYAKKFGGRSGDDPDWFKLTITGISLTNSISGELDFFLADYRYDDNALDYVVKGWSIIDLSSLGVVKRLEFELASSDAGTPLYFCMDDLKGRVHY